jgi:hypothetical protein
MIHKLLYTMEMFKFVYKYQFKTFYTNYIISKLQNTLNTPSSADRVNKRSPDELICGKV